MESGKRYEDGEAERRKKQDETRVLEELFKLYWDNLRLRAFPPYTYMPDKQSLIYTMRFKDGVPLGSMANAIAEALTKCNAGFTIDPILYDRLSDESKKLFTAETVITRENKPSLADRVRKLLRK